MGRRWKSPVQVDFGDPGSTTDRRWIHYINADGTRGKMRQFDHLPQGANINYLMIFVIQIMLVLTFIIAIKKISL